MFFSFALIQKGKEKWELSLNWANVVLVEPIQWLMFVTIILTYSLILPASPVLSKVAFAVLSKKNLNQWPDFGNMPACLYFVASVASGI